MPESVPVPNSSANKKLYSLEWAPQLSWEEKPVTSSKPVSVPAEVVVATLCIPPACRTDRLDQHFLIKGLAKFSEKFKCVWDWFVQYCHGGFTFFLKEKNTFSVCRPVLCAYPWALGSAGAFCLYLLKFLVSYSPSGVSWAERHGKSLPVCIILYLGISCMIFN